MQTTWDYSLASEIQRVLYTAKQTSTGFYRANGFPVLPYLAGKSTVILPDLPYLSIPRFWSRTSHLPEGSKALFSAPQDLIDHMSHLLKAANIVKPDFTQTKKLWTKHQNKIISEIYRLIPSKKNFITKLIIHPTSFGTGGSFTVLGDKPGPIHIWMRQDRSIAHITEAILTSLTRHDVYHHLGGIWQESEIIVDWLLSYSPLAKIVGPHTGTIPSTRAKQNGALVQKSAQFMAKISAPIASPTKIDTSTFTSHEKQLFDLLASRSPNIVTFDELATNPENFSLYAISKNIQRLRDKLEKIGVSGSFIQTKRREGYFLIK